MADLGGADGSQKKEKKASKKKKSTKKNVKFSDKNEEQERKAELERRLRTQLAYEKKAHDLTLTLIEDTVDGPTLIQAVLQMAVSHYQDVTEERALGHTCGYPLCDNTIKQKVTQKYHISARTNQVIDLTERKNFCSNLCYKASKYLEAQIPSNPVWARSQEELPNIELLEASSSSRPGVAVSVVQNPRTELKSEVEQLEKGGQGDKKKLGQLSPDGSQLDKSKLGQLSPTGSQVDKSKLSQPTPSVSQDRSTTCENEDTMDFLQSLKAAREKHNTVVAAESPNTDIHGFMSSDTQNVMAGVISLGACGENKLSNLPQNSHQSSACNNRNNPSSDSQPDGGQTLESGKPCDQNEAKLKDTPGDTADASASASSHQSDSVPHKSGITNEAQAQPQGAAQNAPGVEEDTEATQKPRRYVPVDKDSMTLGEVAKQVSALLMLDGVEDDENTTQNEAEDDDAYEDPDICQGFPAGISQTLKGCMKINPKRNLYSNIEPREAAPVTDEKARILAEMAAKRERMKKGIKSQKQELERRLSEQESSPSPVARGVVNRSLSDSASVGGVARVPPLHPHMFVSSVDNKSESVPIKSVDIMSELDKQMKDIHLENRTSASTSATELNRKMENVSLDYSTINKNDEILLDDTPKASAESEKNTRPSNHGTITSDNSVPYPQETSETALRNRTTDHSQQQDKNDESNPRKDKTSGLPSTSKKVHKSKKQGRIIEKKGKISSQFQEICDSSVKHHGLPRSGTHKPVSTFDLISATLNAWCTPSTLRYLLNFESADGEMSREEFRLRYKELGKRVDRGEFEVSGEDDVKSTSAPKTLNKIPDMKRLWEDTKAFDLHVREFYKGSFTYRVSDQQEIPEEEPACEKTPEPAGGIQEKETPSEPILPLVDSQAQLALRRRIVLDKLNRAFPDLLAALHLSIQDVSIELRLLVHTFSLTKDNIILKPAEWTVMAYMLLQLLALQVPKVKQMLSKETSDTFLTTFVKSIGVSHEDIIRVVKELTTVA